MDPPKRLPWSQRIFYGVGHCLNDFVASMWFSYLMVYLQLVLGFDANYAGFLLLIGQVADAVATPFLGFEVSSDARPGSFARRYGKRKCLHLFGTICVIASFPFMFSVCPGCENASEFALMVMLVPLVIIFQIGWAAVQVSHLSLIPAITPHEEERDFLNVLRYAVDIASDVSTYVIVWLVFDLTRKPAGNHHTITREYSDKFLLIVIIVVGIGTFFSALFHLGVKEVQGTPLSSAEDSIEKDLGKLPPKNQPSRTENDSLLSKTVTWRGWIREVHFYQVGMLYMFVRLFQNMGAVFMPLYLQESLKANDDFIAKIPLVMNVSSFVISCSLPKFFKVFSKKITLLVGAAMGVGACFWVSVGSGDGFCNKGVYGVGVLMGAASSILVVSTLSFIHDLIGTSHESGAFVYGCMSFFDKLANGVGAMVVQYMHSATCRNCDWFYRDVLSYGVGSTAVIAGFIIFTLLPAKLGQRQSRYNRPEVSSKSNVITYTSLVDAKNERKPLLPKKSSQKETVNNKLSQ